MNHLKPKSLLVLGILLITGSFLYDAVFINIPPQDPPLELVAKRNNQYLIRNLIWYTGLALFISGVCLYTVKKLKSKAT